MACVLSSLAEGEVPHSMNLLALYSTFKTPGLSIFLSGHGKRAHERTRQGREEGGELAFPQHWGGILSLCCTGHACL